MAGENVFLISNFPKLPSVRIIVSPPDTIESKFCNSAALLAVRGSLAKEGFARVAATRTKAEMTAGSAKRS
ncbi:hypothetical protein [Pseudooceanicola sp.]|uniref:hypothetical protein n=1 Tax=Pseudooceanicola sp. TaxID=1914328 RepID=UPI00351729CB